VSDTFCAPLTNLSVFDPFSVGVAPGACSAVFVGSAVFELAGASVVVGFLFLLKRPRSSCFTPGVISGQWLNSSLMREYVSGLNLPEETTLLGIVSLFKIYEPGTILSEEIRLS